METVLIALDIECAGCAASIQKALGRQTGVQMVSVDVPTKQVRVTFEEAKTNGDRIAETLMAIGFPPQRE